MADSEAKMGITIRLKPRGKLKYFHEIVSSVDEKFRFYATFPSFVDWTDWLIVLQLSRMLKDVCT